jgi:hypothetical protein
MVGRENGTHRGPVAGGDIMKVRKETNTEGLQKVSWSQAWHRKD